MIKVDELYPFSIVSSIGPTGTIKRLFKNRDYFNSRGYDMTVYANHPAKKSLFGRKYVFKEMTELPFIKENSNETTTGSRQRKQLHFSKLVTFVNDHRLTAKMFVYRNYYLGKSYINDYISQNRNPDIVVVHDFISCYLYLKYRKEKRAKVVQFIHADGDGFEMFLKSKNITGTSVHRRFQKIYDFAIDNCDQIVYISKLAANKFIDRNPKYAGKVCSVVNGIDDVAPITDAKPSSSYKYRLVCTGGVSPRKGQWIVVEAMHRMNPEVLKDVHFTVIGSGPDHNVLVERVKEYGIAEHFSFLGNKPNNEVHELLCKENIYILMSNNEGLPISIIEAMRAGLPVISTRVAGIPEEVDERNGFLLEPDVDQLIELLNQLPEYNWEQLGKNSRRRFDEEFTFDIMKKNYADMFDRLPK